MLCEDKLVCVSVFLLGVVKVSHRLRGMQTKSLQWNMWNLGFDMRRKGAAHAHLSSISLTSPKT